MAYLTVTTHLDVVAPGDGQLSLREAITQANATAAADTIRFVATLAGETLVLTGGELTITQRPDHRRRQRRPGHHRCRR